MDNPSKDVFGKIVSGYRGSRPAFHSMDADHARVYLSWLLGGNQTDVESSVDVFGFSVLACFGSTVSQGIDSVATERIETESKNIFKTFGGRSQKEYDSNITRSETADVAVVSCFDTRIQDACDCVLDFKKRLFEINENIFCRLVLGCSLYSSFNILSQIGSGFFIQNEIMAAIENRKAGDKVAARSFSDRLEEEGEVFSVVNNSNTLRKSACV